MLKRVMLFVGSFLAAVGSTSSLGILVYAWVEESRGKRLALKRAALSKAAALCDKNWRVVRREFTRDFLGRTSAVTLFLLSFDRKRKGQLTLTKGHPAFYLVTQRDSVITISGYCGGHSRVPAHEPCRYLSLKRWPELYHHGLSDEDLRRTTTKLNAGST